MSDKKRKTTNALILLSGGIDSMATAHFYRVQGYAISCLFFDYGQAAKSAELKAARAIAEAFDHPLTVAQINERSYGAGELIGRNLFLLSAALFLQSPKSGIISMGLHGGTPYYDCSPDFLSRCDDLVSAHTDGCVRFASPLLNWTKSEVYQYVVDQGLPIGSTYSCEACADVPCGECLSCRDRTGLHALLSGG